ncbi:WHG domain-containing protein [Streptomyces javensis]|uniref:WHG domain-containing protein n=2 Tax=Streptomyces javensis TaxID=114698 RepID=A0ABS0R2S4_9ACTN|nr:WHG domain-containing protein [Streptomyces javensis]
MREAVANGPRGRAAVAALTDAYVDFAERNPALYDAMFLLDTGLPFADEATPAPLREAFETLVDTLGDIAGPADPALFEIFWSALHGLVSLTRSGRLPRQEASRRLGVLVDRFAERGGDG